MKKILTALLTLMLSACGTMMNKINDEMYKCGPGETAKPVFNTIGLFSHAECVRASGVNVK